MRKITLLLFIVGCFCNVFAQDKESSQRRNDLMLSPIELIGGPILNVSYERLLNSNSGIGINALISLQNDEFNDFYQFSPYYRMYFGKKFASGFFVEAFIPITTSEIDVYNYYNANDYENLFISETNTTVGFGIGAGAKWTVRNNIVFEFSGGLARRFAVKNSDEITGKGMLGIGYRF